MGGNLVHKLPLPGRYSWFCTVPAFDAGSGGAAILHPVVHAQFSVLSTNYATGNLLATCSGLDLNQALDHGRPSWGPGSDLCRLAGLLCPKVPLPGFARVQGFGPAEWRRRADNAADLLTALLGHNYCWNTGVTTLGTSYGSYSGAAGRHGGNTCQHIFEH